MNIFQKFTLRSLKQNRTRTMVTIVGIILSVAMITAVTTTVSSLQQFMLEETILDTGSWHVLTEDINAAESEKIQNREEVENYAVLKNIGYAKLDKSRNKEKPYLYIAAYAGNFEEQLSVTALEGRLPQNSSEIALPTSLASNGGVRYKLGETLSLSVGIRKSAEQKLLWQSYADEETIEKETFVEQGKKAYQVVGFYESATIDGNSSAVGYPALTKADDTEKDLGERLYITMKEPEKATEFANHLKVKEDSRFHVLPNVHSNKYYLLYAGYSTGNSIDSVLSGLMLILIGIIMFGSISLIGNSFSISVNERKKQFGLLSSIGATRKQLKRGVFFEAVVLSAIGIPLGILAGIGGMTVTFHVVGELFKSMSFSGRAGDQQLQMHMAAAGWAVLLAAGIGFLTILISAYLPARKALKVSAIQTIRQTADIRIRSRQIKTSRITGRLFGIEGVLASKNFKRNRRKYRATVFSLFISVVLFISATSFFFFFSKGLDVLVQEYDYDISYRMEESPAAEKIYRKMSQVKGVTKSGYYFDTVGGDMPLSVIVPDKNINEQYRKDGLLSEPMDEKQEKIVPSEWQMVDNVYIMFVEDNEYRQYLKSRNLRPEEYINGKQSKAVIADKITVPGKEGYAKYHILSTNPQEITLCYPKKLADGYAVDTGVRTTGKNGQLLYRMAQYETVTQKAEDGEEYQSEEEIKGSSTWVEAEKVYDKRVTLSGTIVEEAPYGIQINMGMVICYPESAMAELCPKTIKKEWVMSFNSANAATTYTEMSDLLAENGQTTEGLNNIADQIQASRSLLIVMRIFSYGFIILISLIAMANVFNTISTNISLRKREFAILQSIGMTKRSFHRMMNYECILYGCKGLIFGLPVAVAVTYFIYRTMNGGVVISFYIPWYSVGIAVVSVFVVVFATMLYATRKLRKDDVVETLKNENF